MKTTFPNLRELRDIPNQSSYVLELIRADGSKQLARVTFADGDTLTTEINGTPDEIRAYYVGNVFNLGSGERDRMARAVAVEILS